MGRSRLRLAAALAAMTLVLTACDGDTPTKETSSMYCDLIDPKTVQPIVGDLKIKDFGGPDLPKSDDRNVQCKLYAPEGILTVLMASVHEVSGDDSVAEERAAIEKVATRYQEDDDALFSSLDEDGTIGNTLYDGQFASARIFTGSRVVSVTAPADAEQAPTFTPLVLKVAQEVNTNLDAWDADHAP